MQFFQDKVTKLEKVTVSLIFFKLQSISSISEAIDNRK